jgi:hypothetical protein
MIAHLGLPFGRLDAIDVVVTTMFALRSAGRESSGLLGFGDRRRCRVPTPVTVSLRGPHLVF